MRNLAKVSCRVLGVAFVAIGLVTFAFGEAADTYHNLLHFVTGVVASYFGFAGSRVAARNFCRIFGGGYLAFGLLGILIGDPATGRLWHVGQLHLALGDHVFHIVLGGLMLAGGIPARVRLPSRVS